MELRDGPVINLGLAAHERQVGDLPNDGAGTYYAQPGSSYFAAGDYDVATWNFDLHIEVLSEVFDPYSLYFEFQYEFDPTAGSTPDGVIRFDFVPINDLSSPEGPIEGPIVYQASQNLGFQYLAEDLFPIISAPSGEFDFNAAGSYNFALVAYQAGDIPQELGRTEMTVNVVPVPAAAWACMALLGVLGTGRVLRRRRQATHA